MKYVLLILFNLPIVLLAIKKKRWYLYLPMAFIGILPEQLSISLHESLPLISATRILIVIMGIFWIVDRVNTKKFSIPKALLIYLLANILISIINLRVGTSEFNRIFLFVFERVLLVVMMKDLIKSKEEFHSCIDFMIMGSCTLAIIGIFQTVFDYDIASVLHLQETPTSVILSQRMGMTRAYGTFNAISYGCFCAMMAMPLYYRLEQTGSVWHSAAFALNIMALICTFTRSAWLCIGGVFLVLIIMRRGKLFKKILPAAGMIVVLCVSLCFIQPNLAKGLIETGKSAANTIISVLPDDLVNFWYESNSNTGDSQQDSETSDSEAERPSFELSEDFGMNAKNPTATRMMQWSAIEYMLNEGEAIFGYGYKAMLRGKIHFFYKSWGNRWVPTTFLDVGFVALLTESGFVGALCHIGLLAYMFICAIRRRSRTAGLDYFKLFLYIIPLYLLLNFLAAFLQAQLIWLLIGTFFAYKGLTEKENSTTALLNEQSDSQGGLPE